jgi:hypothetical protein
MLGHSDPDTRSGVKCYNVRYKVFAFSYRESEAIYSIRGVTFKNYTVSFVSRVTGNRWTQ